MQCATLPDGFWNVAYTFTFTLFGGTPPFVFSVSVGALPPGLALNASTGTISGVPTSLGLYSFTVRVVDALGAVATCATSITISGAASLSLFGVKLYRSGESCGEAVSTPEIPKVDRAL
jgi:hypothetical protein